MGHLQCDCIQQCRQKSCIRGCLPLPALNKEWACCTVDRYCLTLSCPSPRPPSTLLICALIMLPFMCMHLAQEVAAWDIEYRPLFCLQRVQEVGGPVMAEG